MGEPGPYWLHHSAKFHTCPSSSKKTFKGWGKSLCLCTQPGWGSDIFTLKKKKNLSWEKHGGFRCWTDPLKMLLAWLSFLTCFNILSEHPRTSIQIKPLIFLHFLLICIFFLKCGQYIKTCTAKPRLRDGEAARGANSFWRNAHVLTMTMMIREQKGWAHQGASSALLYKQS